MIEIQSNKRSVNRRTNLLAREIDDCIMVPLVPLEKERVLFICFGMVLNEVMLRWRSAIDTNVPLDGVSISIL